MCGDLENHDIISINSRLRAAEIDHSVGAPSPAENSALDVLFYLISSTIPWLKKEKFESIRLVTASYHMPRSLVEFRSVMRNIEIMPHPVFPESFKAKEWWLWPGSTGLIMEEYNKYLLAIFRRTFIGPVFG